ncbi:Coenzyme F420 hydrogenase/dehydrogenase, beta subunit C-terminal domain [Citrobacter braakii]|uniref:Coenzyme F420 hydrogenase/dehydrogenase, beta subunit C-terminal domain n=1 Tax=Citrobacter braakii TaxID=57706 RepID=UPI0025A91732|nr:Coenzyme F420 hydrogenase/dehydrogenase, beta subunit C-terminal domain [Citrobacter braakii]EKW2139053.1 Coenzyme F420 hydrogenase/dehydrogenase, beta subunit C-terminal domain [Citrobacter braakii]MDW2593407.1 Coenzyme F420 hydrogenase/dehydrogenase, beta subunit C-terminal domain [Citrobacter braakii]MDW2657260.1 Coenzyme F420 hydrogenase/dehydrogenase, beta subunit C-terminal domain [Citrobacter braakii]MDW2704935.1 Coenzyme F420 hydrogenase/dehydrogenase, beta subunit C-terminal domain 
MKLKTILDNELCSGCGLCSSVFNESISMEMSQKGYLRPKALNDSALDIDLPFCPGAGLLLNSKEGEDYLNWGRIIECKVGFSTSEDVRYKGSSGGVLSQIGIYLLEENIVDGVIHIGVDEIDPLRNIVKLSKTKQDILNNAGSRYAPASPLQFLLQLISENEQHKYAFIGKPCDVGALRMFLEQNPVYANNITFILSFMCAGTPSIAGTDEVLRKLNVQKENLISFRYRGDGWPGVTKAIDKDLNQVTMTYNESWGNILGKHLQKRCKLCPDGIGEFADIVCADAWYGDESGYPDFDEKEGRSLILGRTTIGVKLLDNMVRSNAIQVESFDISKLNIIQPAQRHRRQSMFARLLAMKIMFQVIPDFKGFNLLRGAKSLTLKRNIYAFAGMILRIYRKKI